MSTTASKRPDRRILRTRQLLFQAFTEVAQEKNIAAISVQDITERANVNRGTFYAHFPDKYALLEAFVREDFRQHLISNFPPTFQCDRRDLQPFIQLVLEYVKGMQRQCRPPDLVAPLISRAIHEELTGMLVRWLKQGQPANVRWRVPIDSIGYMLSWAIFGAAAQLSQTTTGVSVEQLAHDVQLVFMEGVTRLADTHAE